MNATQAQHLSTFELDVYAIGLGQTSAWAAERTWPGRCAWAARPRRRIRRCRRR
jgi:hypothetical protein